MSEDIYGSGDDNSGTVFRDTIYASLGRICIISSTTTSFYKSLRLKLNQLSLIRLGMLL